MFKRISYLLGLFALILIVTQSGAAQSTGGSAIVEVNGWFSVLWGDGSEENPGSVQKYILTTSDGAWIQLFNDEASIDWLAYDRQEVLVRGSWVRAPGGNAMPVLRAATLEAAQPGLVRGSYVVGSQPWVSILCKFSDIDDEPKDLAYFEEMYSAEFPGLDHFWREQSYDLINLEGSGVVDWVDLPYPREYYVPPDAVDMNYGLAMSDCITAADSYVDFSQYVGINMMFNAVLDCCAWGLPVNLTLDGDHRVWLITWEPPWGYANIGVIAHETGHGFGMLHSSGEYGEVYDNAWDVMSDVWSNKARGAIDEVYGGLPQHTIAYHKELLGWINDMQTAVIRTGMSRTLTLERVAQPLTNNYLGAVVLIDNNPERFISVEVRQQVGYDFWLPAVDGWNQSVIIHDVDFRRSEPAHILDIDYNGDTGDAGAMWLPGEIYFNPTYGIKITIVSASPTGFTITVQNRYDGVGFNGSE